MKHNLRMDQKSRVVFAVARRIRPDLAVGDFQHGLNSKQAPIYLNDFECTVYVIVYVCMLYNNVLEVYHFQERLFSSLLSLAQSHKQDSNNTHKRLHVKTWLLCFPSDFFLNDRQPLSVSRKKKKHSHICSYFARKVGFSRFKGQ